MIFESGVTTDVGRLLPDAPQLLASYTAAINDGGVSVINSQNYRPDGGGLSSHIYADGVLTQIGGGAGYQSRDINNLGVVVGTHDSTQLAFLWQNGELFDLNALVINPRDGWRITDAVAINDSNQIAVTACTFYSCGAMLLTAVQPVPEPETCVMLLGGLGLLGYAARRRRAGPRHNEERARVAQKRS